jgi:hypothetical protein
MLEKWSVIAQQISVESDSATLVALVREANLLLYSRPSAEFDTRQLDLNSRLR